MTRREPRIVNDDSHLGGDPKQRGVKVLLECGCTLTLRNRPMSRKAKYSCRSGMGHGYSVRWKEVWDGDKHDVNEQL